VSIFHLTELSDRAIEINPQSPYRDWDRDKKERFILDLAAVGLKTGPTLNSLAAMGRPVWKKLRAELSKGLSAKAPNNKFKRHLVPMKQAELFVPVSVGDYSDFFTGIHHATNMGKMLRPDNPLLPNYKWVPIGYHGRASSILASGRAFHRPHGQIKPPDAEPPSLAPSARLDYELELGVIVGSPNELGSPVRIADAESHVLGLTLLNDWSARDVQAWEYQPLGPFLAKNFATTLSPWIVTLDALAPFREAFVRPAGDPSPLPYLDSPANRATGVIGIELEVWLETAKMRSAGHAGDRLSHSNYRDAYWTIAQLLAHHTVNGCPLNAGDLLGTGTISGPTADQGGSMLELSRGGKEPILLSSGETRTFIEDGDTVILRAYCERERWRRIGLGECRGTVLPATKQ